MTQPLTITFTLQQTDDILGRGAMLTDAHKATQAFLEAMKTHKPSVVTAEGEPTKKARKARTKPAVAQANGTKGEAEFFGKGPDGAG